MPRAETAAVDLRTDLVGVDSVNPGGGGLMVTFARGGESAFVVPHHAECLVEVRTIVAALSGWRPDAD
jgi:hypothetical protein